MNHTVAACLLAASLFTHNSYASIVDPAPFRDAAKVVCQHEPSGASRVSCMVRSAKRYSYVKSISATPSGKKVISLCSQTVNLLQERGLYYLLVCAEDMGKLYSNHPEPKWLDWKLKISELRSQWVSECFRDIGPEVDDCVSSKSSGFHRFWEEYSKASSRSEMQPIYRCVNSDDFKKTDFSKYLACRAGAK
tara:strand:+ start:4013 stop:4588 length:576 start_codon:yes stop_codon:yes gene_type:complete